MFRHNSYAPLPTDPEAGPSIRPFKQKSRKLTSLRFVFRPKVILLISVISVLAILLDIRSKTWVGPVYVFNKEVRPEWLNSPSVQEPLLFRVAVISHPSEGERRRLIRDSIFKGVPSNEINLEYRFFVGTSGGNSSGEILDEIWREERQYKDMVILDMPDTYEKLAEKRYAALKWVSRTLSSFQHSTFRGG